MKLVLYGGSFDPPHSGHIEAARAAAAALEPDKLLIMPCSCTPGKESCGHVADDEARLEMCRAAFADIDGAEVSDLELRRGGNSFTADTVKELKELYPGCRVSVLVGADVLVRLSQWHDSEYLFRECSFAVLTRNPGEESDVNATACMLRKSRGAEITVISHEPVPAGSSYIRQMLMERKGREFLPDKEYGLIIRRGYYSALPELGWLREKAYAYLNEKRVAHVAGCEQEAVRLACRWGEDADTAATAGILHDITKKLSYDEQLILCGKYDIILDKAELANPKLLHARTGAALARDIFGVSDVIYEAIRWHTTGKPDMTTLEKIIYLADYIEPTRDFPGVDSLREVAYKDLDSAMALGLEMSLAEIRSYNTEPYKDSVDAYYWYKK